MKKKNFFKNSSLFGKNFKMFDLILNCTLIFSFVVFIFILLVFFAFIIKNGISHLNFKLIYNKVDGIQKGILPVIINTFYVVLITLLISAPIGISVAIYMTQYAKSQKYLKLLNFLINILSSIPTILIGLFGYNVFCGVFGFSPSIFVGCLTMSFCILPNIIETSKEAILAVPKAYRNGALSLGAENFQIIFNLILPNAIPGIITAIILAAGKIMGESAALLLTVGASSKMPTNFLKHIFSSGKTLTLHLYFTAGNATSKNSFNICFAVALILIFMVFLLNCLTKLILKLFKKF